MSESQSMMRRRKDLHGTREPVVTIIRKNFKHRMLQERKYRSIARGVISRVSGEAPVMEME